MLGKMSMHHGAQSLTLVKAPVKLLSRISKAILYRGTYSEEVGAMFDCKSKRNN